MTLDYAVTELEPLSFLLHRLLDQVCARLEARSLAASAFCLRFALKDSVEEESKVKSESSVSMMESRTYEKMLRLPVPMRDSKTLLKLLRLQLQSDPPHGSIVKIALTAEPARPRAGQKGLFVPDSPDREKLEVTIARIAGLVGNSNVGSPQLVDTHRPGEFRMFPFSPASEESSGSQKREPRSRRTAIAFRMFRPELLANVESREGCPFRIRFRGACGNVISASGPWRTSGDWWEMHGWREDEWDVEIHFDSSGKKQVSLRTAQNGLYRIYYDWMRRGWFVRGRYD
jgi:protein ImuB